MNLFNELKQLKQQEPNKDQFLKKSLTIVERVLSTNQKTEINSERFLKILQLFDTNDREWEWGILLMFFEKNYIPSSTPINLVLEIFKDSSESIKVEIVSKMLEFNHISINPPFILVYFNDHDESIKASVFQMLLNRNHINSLNLVNCISLFYNDSTKLFLVRGLGRSMLESITEPNLKRLISSFHDFNEHSQILDFLKSYHPDAVQNYKNDSSNSTFSNSVVQQWSSNFNNQNNFNNQSWSHSFRNPFSPSSISSQPSTSNSWYTTGTNYFPSIPSAYSVHSSSWPYSSTQPIQLTRPIQSNQPIQPTQPTFTTKIITGIPTEQDLAKDEDISSTNNTELICTICLTNKRKILFINCQHFVLCYACTRTLTTQGNKKCPICRNEIKSMSPVIIS